MVSTYVSKNGLFPVLMSAAFGELEAYQICTFVIQIYILYCIESHIKYFVINLVLRFFFYKLVLFIISLSAAVVSNS